ncbi:MAG: hypothetical protein ACJASQ_002999 [Crocinitomicaceae bacterium]|jgi:hypothetical protein
MSKKKRGIGGQLLAALNATWGSFMYALRAIGDSFLP